MGRKLGSFRGKTSHECAHTDMPPALSQERGLEQPAPIATMTPDEPAISSIYPDGKGILIE
jgi:hypothetical protein